MKEFKLAFRERDVRGKQSSRITERRVVNPDTPTKNVLRDAKEYAEKNNWILIAVDQVGRS